jgi:uncharacterized protein (DUF2336 family)
MSDELRVLQDLELSLKTRSSSERVKVLRSVTDLFLSGAGRYCDSEIDLFDDVLNRLIQHVEARAVAQLSADLAPIDTAPAKVVRGLARHDDITISGPVLKQSQRLDTQDLVEIARTKSQAHLLAIGSRSSLTEAVTDVLVDRGDTEVIKVVASNRGAQFSRVSFSSLVTRAEAEEGLTEILALRDEISPEQMHHLVAKATDSVRDKLIATAEPAARARIEGVLQNIASGIDTADRRRPRDYRVAQQLAERMRHDPALMRARLKEAAEAGEFELAVALLAVLGKAVPATVERLLAGSDPGGLLLLCKALGLQWPIVRAVLLLHRAGERAPQHQLDRWRDQLAKINLSTAMRVVRFWQVRAVVTASSAASQELGQESRPSGQDDWGEWSVH